MERARPSPSAPTALPRSVAVFATSETLCGSTTTTLSDADWSFSIVPSENFTVKTRSGLSATTFSKFTLMPPTCSREAASAGSSEKSSTPTTRGPAPRAKRNAVIDGPIDTSRSGRAGTVTGRFWKSVSVAGNGDAVREGDGETETAPPQEASVRRRTARSERKRDRCRIWRTPFLRRRVCRGRMSQATRVEAFAFHGGATLPEFNRLRWNPAYEVFREALRRARAPV